MQIFPMQDTHDNFLRETHLHHLTSAQFLSDMLLRLSDTS